MRDLLSEPTMGTSCVYIYSSCTRVRVTVRAYRSEIERPTRSARPPTRVASFLLSVRDGLQLARR